MKTIEYPSGEDLSNHYSRPKECPTKLLVEYEKKSKSESNTLPMEFLEPFLKELQFRRNSKRDLKALRASRRELYMEYIREKTTKQAQYSGDVRKFFSKK